MEIADPLGVVAGDRPGLLGVFRGLIDNARKFMGSAAEPRIVIGSRRDGGERILYVSDNGIGIDPRYHDKVFGLFEQLDPSSEGTGAGLALVKRIVQVHGGRIWVESEGQGRGCTVWFALPAAEGTESATGASPPDSAG